MNSISMKLNADKLIMQALEEDINKRRYYDKCRNAPPAAGRGTAFVQAGRCDCGLGRI
mgnify:CR=1 FL=1